MQSFIFHYGIPFYNYIKTPIETIYKNITLLIDYTIKGINSDTIVFYNNNPAAYIASYIDSHNILNGVIIWKYSRSKKLFFQYKCTDTNDVKYLPILFATVELNDKPVFDISNFINEISVEKANIQYPNLSHIVEVWSYTTGIVFDRSLDYKIRFLDNELNESVISLFESYDFITKNNKIKRV